MYFVYLLKCSDDTLYCGYTLDVKSRVIKHNVGKGAKYTVSRRPVNLVYWEKYTTKSLALRREYQIKKLSRSEKLALLKGFVPH